MGEGGLSFTSKEEIPSLLDQLIEEYPERQTRIFLPTLAEVGDRYLGVMGIGDRAG